MSLKLSKGNELSLPSGGFSPAEIFLAPKEYWKTRRRSEQHLDQRLRGLLEIRVILSRELSFWCISEGTALGAHRDGDFIPWDWDVGLTVFTEEVRPLLNALCGEFQARDFRITKVDNTFHNFKIVLRKYGSDYEIHGRYLSEDGAERLRVKTSVPSRYFKKIETVSLRGHQFPAPGPIEEYLSWVYGDWQVPRRTANKQRYLSGNFLRLS